jgi:hypothetical protein
MKFLWSQASFARCSVISNCSHVIHITALSAPASGLRLETAANLDKKKSELYFLRSVKKSLTENRIEAGTKMMKFFPGNSAPDVFGRCSWSNFAGGIHRKVTLN